MNIAAVQHKECSSAPKGAEIGFHLPAVMPNLPVLDGPRGLLSAQGEQDLGFRIIHGQLDLLRALAVDTSIVKSMVNEIWDALGEGDYVEKAVALVYDAGVWIRGGQIPNKDFAVLARRKLNTIRTLIAELNAFSTNGLEETIFTAAVREDLRQKLSELVPYDFILNRAAQAFRVKCKGLNLLCKDLIKFIADEVRIPRSKVGGIVSGNWTSPLLIPSLLQSGGYELKLYPPAELRRLRLGIIERQKMIIDAASEGEAPATDLLASWTLFCRFDVLIERCVDLFVKANVRLVERVARNYRFSDIKAVRSAADMGLVRAVYRFKPELGFKFSTIAVQWIQQTILRDLKGREMLRLPDNGHKILSGLKAALTDYPNASKAMLMELTGLDLSELNNYLHVLGIGRPLSIDTAFQDDGSSETDGLHDMLADPNNCFVDDLIDENAGEHISDVLTEVLNAREYMVITKRFGLAGEEAKTLEEMSEIMQLSRERVRQIQVQGLAKLRDSEFSESLMEIWA